MVELKRLVSITPIDANDDEFEEPVDWMDCKICKHPMMCTELDKTTIMYQCPKCQWKYYQQLYPKH